MKRHFSLALIFSLLWTLTLVSCDLKNDAPIIHSITADPHTVGPDGSCTIRVMASDLEDDKLTYSFSATDGEIQGDSDTETWMAPSTEGSYVITVTVGDGKNSSKGQVVVLVKAGFPGDGGEPIVGDWIQHNPSSHPSARWFHAMSYIAEGQVLLFGGRGGKSGPGYQDTWVYDLSNDTWTQKNPSPRPSPRWNCSISYIGEDKIVLFGGNISEAVNNDTWVYDLSENTWVQKNPSSRPAPRRLCMMAHIGEDKVVLFGGDNNVGTRYDDTWVYELSANAWTRKRPSSHPSARSAHAMSYLGGDKALFFGGWDGARHNDTWVYDLSDDTWTEKRPSSHPLTRQHPVTSYLGGDKALLFGGCETGDGPYYDDTWVYDLSDNTWVQETTMSQPSGRTGHRLSETSMAGSTGLVLFGGYDGAFDDETWTYR